MEQRTIGTRRVSELGYGGMYLSVEGRPSEEQALETLDAACRAFDHGRGQWPTMSVGTSLASFRRSGRHRSGRLMSTQD